VILEPGAGPLRGVIWSHLNRDWIWAPGPTAKWLYDDSLQDQRSQVDRTEAERVAREALGTTLPTEEELRRICAEGDATRTDR
jgi:hypothetical protein